MEYWSDFGDIESTAPFRVEGIILPELVYVFGRYEPPDPDEEYAEVVRSIILTGKSLSNYDKFRIPLIHHDSVRAKIRAMLAHLLCVGLEETIYMRLPFQCLTILEGGDCMIFCGASTYAAVPKDLKLATIRFDSLRDLLWHIPEVKYVRGQHIDFHRLFDWY